MLEEIAARSIRRPRRCPVVGDCARPAACRRAGAAICADGKDENSGSRRVAGRHLIYPDLAVVAELV
jgi:hypothetical protein